MGRTGRPADAENGSTVLSLERSAVRTAHIPCVANKLFVFTDGQPTLSPQGSILRGLGFRCRPTVRRPSPSSSELLNLRSVFTTTHEERTPKDILHIIPATVLLKHSRKLNPDHV